MKTFDGYLMIGITEEDNKAILEELDKEIDLTIDNAGRVYNSGGIYIADAKEVESGEGILCR